MIDTTTQGKFWPQIWQIDRWRGHLLISLVFLLLLISLVVSLGRYWANTLQPRLYANAETQAQILAQSQAPVLVQILNHSQPNETPRKIFQAIQEMLLATDPAINDRMVRNITLLIDYDIVNVAENSLDFSEGDINCVKCFHLSMPLINQAGDLMGVADFAISERYYTILSQEMKSKLYTETSLALVLLLCVWIAMLFMFDRLHKAKQLIEASDQAKTRFMANVTHELRTPLNAILGYTQIYKVDPELSATHKQGIDTIDRSAQHLLLLINDILDFSRTDQKGLQLNPSEIHFPTLINTLEEITRISAKLKGVTFKSQLPEHLPSYVWTDDKRLRQVLLNLLNNAVKFTEKGEVNFDIKLLRQETGRVVIRFSVKDSGIGIAKTDLNSIFIPFHQLDNHITRAEGSGLGLTISQHIVRLMGGEIKIKSHANVGSEFWFDLNLKTSEHLEKAASSSNAKSSPIFSLPPTDILKQLLASCREHNVLAIRKQIKILETNPQLTEFMTEIQPFISNYRYKQLGDWLEQLTRE